MDEPAPGYPKRLVPRNEAAAKKLKARTLTNLYNARPQWLADTHADLDATVAIAYGWPADLPAEDALRRLLDEEHRPRNPLIAALHPMPPPRRRLHGEEPSAAATPSRNPPPHRRRPPSLSRPPPDTGPGSLCCSFLTVYDAFIGKAFFRTRLEVFR